MQYKNMGLTIASPPDKENLVAELSYKGEDWGLVTWEAASPIINIYPNLLAETWEFELDELIEILKQAKYRLTKES